MNYNFKMLSGWPTNNAGESFQFSGFGILEVHSSRYDGLVYIFIEDDTNGERITYRRKINFYLDDGRLFLINAKDCDEDETDEIIDSIEFILNIDFGDVCLKLVEYIRYLAER